jgi:hypothetical protein
MVATSHFKQPNNWEVYRQRTKAFAAGKVVGAVSGIGSTPNAAKPLVKWLLAWLATSDVKSMVEASCGHWPSGWQAGVHWPHLSYTGVDLLKEQVDANAALVSKRGAASFGLTNATFQVGSMTMAALPTADLCYKGHTDPSSSGRHQPLSRPLRPGLSRTLPVCDLRARDGPEYHHERGDQSPRAPCPGLCDAAFLAQCDHRIHLSVRSMLPEVGPAS